MSQPARVMRRHRRQRRIARLPRPLPHQQEVLRDKTRNKVLAGGRRVGKSTCGLIACLEGHGPRQADGRPLYPGALYGRDIWWVVPDYPTSGHGRWRDLKKALRGCWVSKSEQEHRIDLPGGGSITVRTAEDPDSLRGDGLDGVVVDEAPLMAERTWTEALRLALLDRRGWSMFLSTPKGKANWFYPLFLRGAALAELERQGVGPEVLVDGWRSWRMPTALNPLIDAEELALLMADVPSQLRAQEVDADFVIFGGNIIKRQWFRYYDVLEGGRFIMLEGDTPRRVDVRTLSRWGIADLAVTTKTSSDYTVLGTLAATDRNELLLLDMIRDRLEAPDIPPMFRDAYMRHRHSFIGVEANAFQLSIVQAAGRLGLPVRALYAEKDKVARAMTLAARMESGYVYFPRHASWLPAVEDELEAFNEGEHDDIVDMLAYAAIEAAGGADNTLHVGST